MFEYIEDIYGGKIYVYTDKKAGDKFTLSDLANEIDNMILYSGDSDAVFLDGELTEDSIDAISHSLLCDVKNYPDCYDLDGEDLDDVDILNEFISEAVYEGFDHLYQFYIVDHKAATLLERLGQYVFYNSDLDLHFWGVSVFGMSWDLVDIATVKQDYYRKG